ncbi:hypothetical protein ES703_56307 [subsurface metagenome]
MRNPTVKSEPGMKSNPEFPSEPRQERNPRDVSEPMKARNPEQVSVTLGAAGVGFGKRRFTGQYQLPGGNKRRFRDV